MLPLLAVLALLATLSSSADVSVGVNVGAQGSSVPPSFMGFSVEPLAQAHIYASTPNFVNLLKNLASHSTGPLVLRWGGAAQDLATEELGDETWETLAMLSREVECVHIIGLSLLYANTTLAVNQVTNAMRILAPDSVLAFEIGNEPDNYQYWHPKSGDYPPKYETNGWYDDQNLFYLALEDVLMKSFGTTLKIAGPAMAALHLWRAGDIKRWLTGGLSKKYASILTAHWYAGVRTWPNSNMDLILSEAKMDSVYGYTQLWSSTAHEKGATFRMGETNSLAKGGKLGVSDTLGGAIFVIDYAMTLLMAGADGVNFHNVPCAPYSALVLPFTTMVCEGGFATCGMTCERGPVAVAGTPYYGVWMMQKILSGNPDLMRKSTVGFMVNSGNESDIFKGTVSVMVSSGNKSDVFKVYGFKANDGEMRVVIVKKSGDTDADVTVRVPGVFLSMAEVILLHAPGNNTLYAQNPDVEIGGQMIDEDGVVFDTGRSTYTRYIPNAFDSSSQTSQYSLAMPMASVALLIIRPNGEFTMPSPAAVLPSPMGVVPPSPRAMSPTLEEITPPSAMAVSPSPIHMNPSPLPSSSPVPSPTPSPLPSPRPLPMPTPSPGPSPTLSPSPLRMPNPPVSQPKPASAPVMPATPNYQIHVVVPVTSRNGVSETTVTNEQCPKFKAAIDTALGEAGVDSRQAYPSSPVNGCSVVTPMFSRVFYKAELVLSAVEFDRLSREGFGFRGEAFVAEAELICSSSLAMGPFNQEATVVVSSADLGTLPAQNECKRTTGA
eukprot:gene32227-16788_t